MKNKMWKIISIVNIIIVLSIVVCLFIKFSKLNNSNELKVISKDINKSVTINAGTYNQIFHVVQMINNYKVGDIYYTKFQIDITNNRNLDNHFNMNEYTLVDENDKTIANCYPNGDVVSSMEISDKMPILTEANKTTSGYLYCNNNYKDAVKLKIRVIDYSIKNDDGSIDYEYINYYIDLI